jgi:hypothetical protein
MTSLLKTPLDRIQALVAAFGSLGRILPKIELDGPAAMNGRACWAIRLGIATQETLGGIYPICIFKAGFPGRSEGLRLQIFFGYWLWV